MSWWAYKGGYVEIKDMDRTDKLQYTFKHAHLFSAVKADTFRYPAKEMIQYLQGQVPIQFHAACNVTTSYTVVTVPQQFSIALGTHNEKLQINKNKQRWLFFFSPTHSFSC